MKESEKIRVCITAMLNYIGETRIIDDEKIDGLKWLFERIDVAEWCEKEKEKEEAAANESA